MVRESGLGDGAAVGRGAMRVMGAIALISLLALGVCASAARAEPLSMTFTEARANVGIQLSVTQDEDALFKPPDTAPLEAQIDPLTGEITGGVLKVPDFETFIEEEINANVLVEFEIGEVTGSFNQATGALTLSGEAGGTLIANEKECTVTTDFLTLDTAGSTGGPSPLSGTPFTHGLTGAGAIAGEWTDMHATPKIPGVGVAVCETADHHIEGPGGVWLEQKGDLTPPPAPQLTGTDPVSPALSGTPRILGNAEAGSTVRLYAGPSCAGSAIATAGAAQLGSPGIEVAVAEGTTAAFSATATDAAGNTSACSATIYYTRLHADPGVACTVPNLVGKRLGRAKALLRAAHCSVGKVHKPRHRKGRRLGPLVVKSSNPAAGTSLAAGSAVNLRLAHKHRNPRR